MFFYFVPIYFVFLKLAFTQGIQKILQIHINCKFMKMDMFPSSTECTAALHWDSGRAPVERTVTSASRRCPLLSQLTCLSHCYNNVILMRCWNMLKVLKTAQSLVTATECHFENRRSLAGSFILCIILL
jgi:hypothetical protein